MAIWYGTAAARVHSKYCRLSGTGEDDAHLPYACSQNRACSEQKSSRETSIDMSCRNESIVFGNRVAAYANLVVRLGGRPTHDNNTCRVFASQESHCFSGGSVKLRAYLEIDKRRLQRKEQRQILLSLLLFSLK